MQFFFVNWFCNMWGNESIGLIGFPLVQIPGFFHHHRKVKLEFGARWRRFWAAENCIRLQGFIGVGVCFSWVNKIQQNGKALFRNRGKQNKSYYEVQSLSFFWLSSSFSVVVSWNCVFVDPRAMFKKIWCKWTHFQALLQWNYRSVVIPFYITEEISPVKFFVTFRCERSAVRSCLQDVSAAELAALQREQLLQRQVRWFFHRQDQGGPHGLVCLKGNLYICSIFS